MILDRSIVIQIRNAVPYRLIDGVDFQVLLDFDERSIAPAHKNVAGSFRYFGSRDTGQVRNDKGIAQPHPSVVEELNTIVVDVIDCLHRQVRRNLVERLVPFVVERVAFVDRHIPFLGSGCRRIFLNRLLVNRLSHHIDEGHHKGRRIGFYRLVDQFVGKNRQVAVFIFLVAPAFCEGRNILIHESRKLGSLHDRGNFGAVMIF